MMLQAIDNYAAVREASCLYCVWMHDHRQGGRLTAVWVDPCMNVFAEQLTEGYQPLAATLSNSDSVADAGPDLASRELSNLMDLQIWQSGKIG